MALHPLGDVLVGGQTAQQLDTSDTAARDLRVIIPAVLLAVLLVLMLLLRSLVAPLVLVVAIFYFLRKKFDPAQTWAASSARNASGTTTPPWTGISLTTRFIPA